MKHTQGKWAVDGITGRIMFEGYQVAKANTCDIANFIVNACNSHPELLEACKETTEYICQLCYRLNPQHKTENCNSCLKMDIWKQAISKAEGVR